MIKEIDDGGDDRANGIGRPVDKLADEELHFTEGALAELKLAGFAVQERRGEASWSVLFQTRQCSVNGKRSAFVMLRPTAETITTDPVREKILRAYADDGKPRRLAH